MKGSGRQALLALALFCMLGALAGGCVRSKPPRALVSPTIFPADARSDAVAQQKVGQAASMAYPDPSATSRVATPTPSMIPPSPTTQPTATPSLPPTMSAATATEQAPTATVLPVTTATPTLVPKTEVTHVVARGETLLSISEQYGTTVVAIMNKNGLVNQNTIIAGAQLVIPVGYAPSETPPTGTIEHVVKQGETLSQLARMYRSSVADIKGQNPAVAADPDHVKAGTKLNITVGTAPPQRTHTVRGGESLSAIARRYGVTVVDIVQANALRNPNRVYAGQVLLIP